MGERFSRIWHELRRRHVVSSAAAYAAVAFVLLQLGEILFPAFGLGAGAMRALVALVISGFPVALALSWVYDVTRSGLRRTDAAEEPGSAEQGPSLTVVAGVVVAAAAVGFAFWYAILSGPETFTQPVREASIAVLPFADMSAEGDHAYLGDGIAEEILNVLASVPGLQVAARTSSFSFREGSVDAREIADRLGVRHILEGSVRRSGDRVRVTAQLIEAETGFHEWSDNYDRTLEDLFDVQDEIAGAIARELVGRLAVADDEPADRTVSPEAEEAYWRGRSQWNRRGPAGIPAAIQLFEEAIALAPEFAEAYAGLADSYALLPQVAPSTDPQVAWDRAEELARRAIDLDATLAGPHASLGLVRALRGDREGALTSLGTAVQLNPSYAPALHWRANVLAEMGRLDEALRDAARAARRDPLSAAIATDHANILLWSDRLAQAEAEYERAVGLDFAYTPALLGSAVVALEQGDAIDVHTSMAQWGAVSGAPPGLAAQLAGGMLAFRGTGTPAPPPPGLEEWAQDGAVSSGTVAQLHALIGDREAALSWLRRAVADGSWVEQYPRVNTVYAPFRDGADFQAVVRETLGQE